MIATISSISLIRSNGMIRVMALALRLCTLSRLLLDDPLRVFDQSGW